MSVSTEAASVSLEAAAALRKAAKIISEHGWRQKPPCVAERGEAACMVDALFLALDMEERDHRSQPDASLVFLHAFSCLQVVTGDSVPARWNDAPGRTKEEVLAALEKAAELAEAT